MAIKEKDFQVFIDGAVRYFQHIPGVAIDIGTPYLVENRSPLAFDISGTIAILGRLRGCVYFSAPRPLLKHLLVKLDEPELTHEKMIDLAGELANTIAGNARSEFGKEFLISVPIVVEGVPSKVHLPRHLRSFVIPLYWRTYEAAIVVCVEKNTG